MEWPSPALLSTTDKICRCHSSGMSFAFFGDGRPKGGKKAPVEGDSSMAKEGFTPYAFSLLAPSNPIRISLALAYDCPHWRQNKGAMMGQGGFRGRIGGTASHSCPSSVFAVPQQTLSFEWSNARHGTRLKHIRRGRRGRLAAA